MIHIENLTINVSEDANANIGVPLDTLNGLNSVTSKEDLANALRAIVEDDRFANQKLKISNDGEKYGFTKGSFDLPNLLEFLADTLDKQK